MTDFTDKYRGTLVGLAIGDTLGMVLEFKDRLEFTPITGPEAGGPFGLALGYWTDDTSMALCLADSLLERGGYDSYDVMNKYADWKDNGYRSSTGVCFDIGNQVSTSLNNYHRHGGAVVPADSQRISSAGNGSIMRLAPVVIAAHASGQSLEVAMELARISARETHFSLEAEAGTALFAALVYNAFTAKSKEDVFGYGDFGDGNVEFADIARQVKNAQGLQAKNLDTSGYIVHSLMVAVWAFMNHDNFKEGALAAVNLGGDADTNGAIYGQLAGAFYGYDTIPVQWRDVLYLEQEIAGLADKLGAMYSCDVLVTRFEEDHNNHTGTHKLEVVQGDITKIKVDAIINAANTKLGGGAGVCGAILEAAGYDDMSATCRQIGGCEYGDAVITPGFALPARFVIHAVGPIYGQHNGNEPDILNSCYWQSLRIAQDKSLRTVAFPLISTGIYGYPKEEAVEIAVTAIREFFDDNPRTPIERVLLCAYTAEDADLVQRALRRT